MVISRPGRLSTENNMKIAHDVTLEQLMQNEGKVYVFMSSSFLPLSYLIQAVTWSNWSHCAALLPSGNIIESAASRGGVKQDTVENFLARCKDWALLEFDCTDPVKFYEFLLSQEGKKYDYTALLGYVMHNRNFQLDSDWFCSEYIESAFIAGDTPHYDSNIKSFVSPEEVFVKRARVITRKAA